MTSGYDARLHARNPDLVPIFLAPPEVTEQPEPDTSDPDPAGRHHDGPT